MKASLRHKLELLVERAEEVSALLADGSVAANGERFADPAKVEKWFGRNCKEVVGRACTPGEKADFVAYMSEVR